MHRTLPDHVKGLLLAAGGGLLLTFDIPFIKLANGEPWSVMLMRSILVLAVGLTYSAWRVWRSGSLAAIIPGKAGVATAILYGLTAALFLSAVFNTSTANLVFILAINPMFSAVLAWIFLGERPSPATLLAMTVMLVGVGIIVHDGLGLGQLLGNVLALLSSLAIAGAITITRASGKDMSVTPMIGAVLPMLLAATMTAQHGFHIESPLWLAVNGLIIIPISFFCLAGAPRYIPGAEVAMFYLLETVMAPIWVWLIFSEIPTRQSLVGGAVLLGALIAHSLWQLRQGRRRVRARSVLASAP